MSPAFLLLEADAWQVGRDSAIALGIVFWLATATWVFRDARRRIEDPWLVAMAAVLGIAPPFLGPLVYLFFRPPDTVLDRRERELEIRAIEERLAHEAMRCPVCRGRVEASFLVCPVCTTRLRHACASCNAPLEPIWQACPYCTAPVAPRNPGDVLQPLRQRRVSDA